MAKDALIELREVVDKGRAGELTAEKRGVIGGALFAHAMLLYARATETSPIDRWKWFGRDMLSEEQRRWHKQVMEYRDKVLAHFGRGEAQSDGPSVKMALIMREPLPGSKTIEVGFFESRANTRASLSTKLYLLVDATLELARKGFENRLQEMHDELHAAAQKDPKIGLIAQAHPFDREAFLDGAEDIDLSGSDERAHHYFRAGRRVID